MLASCGKEVSFAYNLWLSIRNGAFIREREAITVKNNEKIIGGENL